LRQICTPTPQTQSYGYDWSNFFFASSSL
jgi:hypothetical protein